MFIIEKKNLTTILLFSREIADWKVAQPNQRVHFPILIPPQHRHQ